MEREVTYDDLKNHWKLSAEVVAAAEAVVRGESREALTALAAAVGAVWADRRRFPPQKGVVVPGWAGGER
jgi:hypothetical protein